MYQQYFGLNEAPFSIAVNPRYLFMSARHRDALAHLLYGVGAGGGFILLTGEVGTGKTTINRCLLEQLPEDTDVAIILNPALNAMELLATACDELGIEYAPEHSLKTLTDQLHRFLLDNHGRGRKTVLLIDEAQHLDFDVLEQIRLLTNLETNSEKLLQIILIGQPELAQMLQRPELRQLNQRITARYNLEPLNRQETAAYINHRLQVAGLAPGRQLFPATVVSGIHRHTRGIPRLINVLCDRMLLGAYGRNRDRVDRGMLKVAVREVMGEEPRLRQRRGWMIPAALAAGLVLGVVTFLAWQERQPVSTAAPDIRAAAVVTPEAEPSPAVEPGPAADPPWLLSPDEALQGAWYLYSDTRLPAALCAGELPAEVACVRASADTWDELRQFNRPLVLDLVTPQRFAAGALLLALRGRVALLATGHSVEEVALAELAPLWSGSYRFLWHPPVDFERPLARGDRGTVVAEVAALFARLDQREQPLARERFNDALEQRVRLFQRAQGLEDDGVVGVRTLLELNQLLGIGVTGERAIARMRAVDDELVAR